LLPIDDGTTFPDIVISEQASESVHV